MIGIYKIINPKGKIYIGQSIDIDRRFNEYKKLQCNQSKKIYYSLKKYGFSIVLTILSLVSVFSKSE